MDNTFSAHIQDCDGLHLVYYLPLIEKGLRLPACDTKTTFDEVFALNTFAIQPFDQFTQIALACPFCSSFDLWPIGDILESAESFCSVGFSELFRDLFV